MGTDNIYLFVPENIGMRVFPTIQEGVRACQRRSEGTGAVTSMGRWETGCSNWMRPAWNVAVHPVPFPTPTFKKASAWRMEFNLALMISDYEKISNRVN